MSMEKKFKFALVGHSEELADAVRQCINPRTEDVIIKVVNIGEAPATAKKLVEEGTEIIFGHGGNAYHMMQEIEQPVVEIPRTYLDMMEAFIKARQYDTRIGLTSFTGPTDGIDLIEEILGIKVRQIVHHTTAQLEQGVRDAFAEGIRVLVGGGISNRTITSLGGKGIVIEPRKSAVEKVFSEARLIASRRRKEAENSARIRTILQMIDDGVIGVDNYGRIDIYNEAAEKILGMDLKGSMQQSLNKILKDIQLIDVLTSGNPRIDAIKKVGRDNIVVNALPIHIEGRSQGAVALIKNVSRIQSINRKLKENLYLKGFVAKHTLDDIIGETPPMQQLKEKVQHYARTHTTTMLQGETGTGKELLAQSIHNLSPRKNQPFVAINCAALPESLLESELFGYEEGAFTGAKRGGKIGLFELANHGTVFLDEIADIPVGLQVRLLRVIENKEVMRVGGDRYVPIDVRIISSSHKDLRQEVNRGNFRADLYYRLAILRLKLPPLRERLDDIEPILRHILTKLGQSSKSVTAEMIAAMKCYHWPGNIRELISFIESYLILLDKSTRSQELFFRLLNEQMDEPATLKTPTPECHLDSEAPLPSLITSSGSLKETLEGYENQVIETTLRACQYNKKETARRLGISVNTLWRKMNTRQLKNDT